jgi:multidrug resistance efflux pump
VWAAAVAGAWKLGRHNIGVGDARAQVVAQEFRVASAEVGRLAEVAVVQGQHVKAGQVLARLDSSVIERELAVAQARRRHAGSQAGAATVAIESGDFGTERAFQAALDDASTRLEEARAEQGRQNIELTHVRAEVARLRKLVAEGLARADRADELDIRRRTLEDSVSKWPARIEPLASRRAEAASRLRQWREAHSAATAAAVRDARVRPALEAASEVDQELRVLRARIEAMRIVAPSDGEVVVVLARVGDIARPGEPVVVLNGTGARQVVAYVAEKEGDRVAPGARALLRRRTPAREEIEARVVRVADNVTQLPARFWPMPTVPTWGREVFLEHPPGSPLDSGEALDVKFLGGGAP